MSITVYDELASVIKKNATTVVDVCNAVMELIRSKPVECQKNYVETLLREFDPYEVGAGNFEKFFSAMQPKNISYAAKEADMFGNRILSNLIKKNVTEAEFYDELWKRLQDDMLSADEDYQTILLVRFWVDPRTPYYQLGDSCTMDDVEFGTTAETIDAYIKKAMFIIHAGLPQKTQKASLLMNLAEEIEDTRERAVFWALAMDQEAIWQSRLTANMANEQLEEA